MITKRQPPLTPMLDKLNANLLTLDHLFGFMSFLRKQGLILSKASGMKLEAYHDDKVSLPHLYLGIDRKLLNEDRMAVVDYQKWLFEHRAELDEEQKTILENYPWGCLECGNLDNFKFIDSIDRIFSVVFVMPDKKTLSVSINNSSLSTGNITNCRLRCCNCGNEYPVNDRFKLEFSSLA